MKKLLSILLVLAMATLLLAGCGGTGDTAGSGGATGAKTDLLLWLPPYATGGEALDQEWWTATLAPWAEENNVNLTIEITPWGNYEEKYLTAFSSGQGPDVGYMYLEMYNDFIDMGALEPLDAYFSAEDTANYIYYDLGNVKGAQYTLPFIVGNARILYFRHPGGHPVVLPAEPPGHRERPAGRVRHGTRQLAGRQGHLHVQRLPGERVEERGLFPGDLLRGHHGHPPQPV